MSNPDPVPATNPPPRRKPLFLIGVLLVILGPALYFVQVGMANLSMPWYLPVLAAAGVACLLASLRQRRSVARVMTATLLTLLSVFQCYFWVIGTKTPPYTGPAQVGSTVPEFSATLADGSAFTNANLEGGRTVLVFNRGRW
jgi:peptidoglycan/LPS O-acetylase OafA/YrhL